MDDSYNRGFVAGVRASILHIQTMPLASEHPEPMGISLWLIQIFITIVQPRRYLRVVEKAYQEALVLRLEDELGKR